MRDLANLIAFARIAEAGSFAEAARRAGTTTSAMSKAVSRLEAARGVRLLHRTTHALSPTAEGERLLEAARALLREAEAVEAALGEAWDGRAAGRVRLTAPGALARACILPLLPALLHAHPEVELEVSFDDALADLGASGFDLALRTGSLDGHPGFVAVRLLTYPMVLCAAPDYLARRGVPKTPADLAGHDLIGFRSRATGQPLAWVFADPAGGAPARFVPRARLVVDDGTAGWAMLCDGLGLTWAPGWLAAADLRAGRVAEVMRERRAVEVPLSAVRLERRLVPRRTRVVLDALAAAALSGDWNAP